MLINSHAQSAVGTRLGYNSHFHEPASGWQALGNGHRIYNPALMLFHSPDDESPFARGGINAYAYCGAEPVNRLDPSGRNWKLMSLAAIFTGLTGALAAAGVAVTTKDDTQRVLAIAGIVTGLAVSAIGTRYVYYKRFVKQPAQPTTTSPRVVERKEVGTQTEDWGAQADVTGGPMSATAPPLSPPASMAGTLTAPRRSSPVVPRRSRSQLQPLPESPSPARLSVVPSTRFKGQGGSAGISSRKSPSAIVGQIRSVFTSPRRHSEFKVGVT